jgi:pimeloyl-ACP methyl ester carboxylesterase
MMGRYGASYALLGNGAAELTPSFREREAGGSAARQQHPSAPLAAVRHAQVHVMPSAGHTPFWDDAPSFNARLGAFSDEVARAA